VEGEEGEKETLAVVAEEIECRGSTLYLMTTTTAVTVTVTTAKALEIPGTSNQVPARKRRERHRTIRAEVAGGGEVLFLLLPWIWRHRNPKMRWR